MINICINNHLDITATCQKCGKENGLRFDIAKWQTEPLEGMVDATIRQMIDGGWDIHAETGKAYCQRCKESVEGAV